MKMLVSGARSMATLDLARHLAQAGHTIITCDTDRAPISRFSKVCSRHYRIPSPRFANETFNQRLVDIVCKEGIDMLIPTWEETFYVSRILDQFPSSCEVFCSPFDKLNRLHNKYQFITLMQELGIETPETVLIEHEEDLKDLPFHTPYALKACYCRGSDSLYKVYPLQPPPQVQIEKGNPWIAQEWIEGERYCTYTICREGEVFAHSTYPVDFARGGKFAVSFTAVEHPAILQWTKKLARALQHTGQIAFDFIEAPSGKLYAIECNPRITSGIHLFRAEDKLFRAFTEHPNPVICPKPGTRQQIVPGMLMFGWRGVRSVGDLFRYLGRLFSVRDTIVRLDDPLPLLTAPFLFIWYWWKSRRLGLSMATKFSYDVEWSHEPPANDEELAK